MCIRDRLRSVPQRVQELEGYRDVDSLWDVAGKFLKNTRKLPEPCHDIGGLQGRRIPGLAPFQGISHIYTSARVASDGITLGKYIPNLPGSQRGSPGDPGIQRWQSLGLATC